MHVILQRLRDERGASAVIVGILIVALVGFAAISVDVGSMYWQRAQLQNAADAAALSAAKSCTAPGNNNCASTTDQGNAWTQAEAQTIANGNASPNPTLAAPIFTSSTVTVKTSYIDMPHPLAALLGIAKSTLWAQATAQWSTTTVGGATVPFAISACVIPSDSSSKSDTFIPIDNSYCSGSISGGFGWLDDGTNSCLKNVTLGEFVSITTGNTGKCSLSDAELATAAAQLGCDLTKAPANSSTDNIVRFFLCMVGKTVYVPVFDNASTCAGTAPAGKAYCIPRYAIFQVYGIHVKINGSSQVDYCMTGRTCSLPGNWGSLGFEGQFLAYSTNSASWAGPGTASSKYGLIK